MRIIILIGALMAIPKAQLIVAKANIIVAAISVVAIGDAIRRIFARF